MAPMGVSPPIGLTNHGGVEPLGLLCVECYSFAMFKGTEVVLYNVSITEAPVRGGVGNPPGLTVSVDPGHRAVWVSPDPGTTPGQPEVG